MANPCKQYMSARSAIFLACLLAFIVQIVVFSPISPSPLEFPPASSAISLPTTTRNFDGLVKLGEAILAYPEDVTVDDKGILYTATRDGWIKRLHKNGSWENWKLSKSNTFLGVATTKEGGILACDPEEGLFRINEDGITLVASHLNGSKISFADDVIEASDGVVYFSVASTKFNFHNWYLDVLEAKTHGQLLKYEPSSGETSIVIDNLGFANGVALSRNEDFLVVCESWKFRCLKHWLKGNNIGKTDIFIKDLPGAPDNINLAPDGSFWIALLQVGFKFCHTSNAIKHLIATFPKSIKYVNGVDKNAMAAKVTADGKIIRVIEDPKGKVMNFVTSALEHEGHLYLGSLNSNFVGKLPLKDVKL